MCIKQSSHVPAGSQWGSWLSDNLSSTLRRFSVCLRALWKLKAHKDSVFCRMLSIYWSTSVNVLVWGSVCVYGCFSASLVHEWDPSAHCDPAWEFWAHESVDNFSTTSHCNAMALICAPSGPPHTSSVPPISPSCLRGLPVRHDSHSHWNEAATSRPVV